MILTTSFFFLATVRSSKNLQKDKLSRYVILSVIATTVVQGVPKYEKLSFFEKFFYNLFQNQKSSNTAFYLENTG
jgi:hypothetical protein